MWRTTSQSEANAEYAAGAATATTPSPLNFADGKFGKAVDFGGAGELRYERRLNLDVDTGSLELWYRGTADSDQMLFRTTPEAFNDADFIALWIWQGMLRVDHHSLPGGPGTGFLVHILDLVEGWHHIAATWDNRSGVVLYLDGRQVAEQDGTWKSTEPRFRHFALSADHRPVVGAVDEVRILNYAADAEQIAADAAASMPFEAPAPGAEEWVPGMAPPVAP